MQDLPGLNSLLQNLPQAYLYLDANGTVLYRNERARDLIGDLQLQEALPDELTTPLSALLENIRHQGEAQFELALRHPDGDMVPAEVQASYEEAHYHFFLKSLVASRTLEGEVAHAYQQLERLVELRTQQLQKNQVLLVHTEKMAILGQMAASISHEINTPIAFITSNLHTLGEYWKELRDSLPKTSSAEDVAGLIKDCRQGLDRVRSIIEDLKVFVRLERPEEEVVDLNEAFEGTLRMATPHLKMGCRLHKCFQELPRIRCFPGQLNQVLLNLLVNAAQALDGEGDIYVETAFEGGGIEIKVRDTGPGIPKEKLGRLFDPFFTTKVDGTGLGLAISKQIVDLHGGQMKVVSEPGHGTEFLIQIPTEGRLAQ